MTDHRDWTGKVGSIWAQEWRRTDRSFCELTPILLEVIGRTGFDNCIDIGCGAGEVSVALAGGNAKARVCGVDISPELLAVARERGSSLANLAFVHGDAAKYVPENGKPDLLVSRHGVMFFPAPVEAFAHLRSISAPHARLVFSCFREVQVNEWVAQTLSVLPKPPKASAPGEPGPFAFGEEGHVRRILEEGGWEGLEFRKVDYRMVFGGGQDPVADACDYLTRVGPTATPIAELDATARAEAIGKLGEVLARHDRDGVVALPAAAWIVTGRAAS